MGRTCMKSRLSRFPSNTFIYNWAAYLNPSLSWPVSAISLLRQFTHPLVHTSPPGPCSGSRVGRSPTRAQWGVLFDLSNSGGDFVEWVLSFSE